MADLRIDAKRLLWTDRHPVAFRAEDIGRKPLDFYIILSNDCIKNIK